MVSSSILEITWGMKSPSDVRLVSGVKWASLCDRPSCIPAPRSQKGAKGAGLRYERLFAKQFPTALHGQWFEYMDREGRGFCQPDLIASFLPTCLVVFEVKYTLCDEAFLQLNNLYLPVVRAAMAAPVVGIVVARNLTRTSAAVVASVEDAMRQDDIPVLHWVGQNVCKYRTHPLKCKPMVEHQFAYPARM